MRGGAWMRYMGRACRDIAFMHLRGSLVIPCVCRGDLWGLVEFCVSDFVCLLCAVSVASAGGERPVTRRQVVMKEHGSALLALVRLGMCNRGAVEVQALALLLTAPLAL
eukprot:TRINITY_DN2755_c0_g1_i1.p3 TRINITY_DN2755_c0_g1~~TRINITY_DN2755_c0_g1_i1.p3  ORF type:complete len:109 (+),score=3.05 TRINITY_DN2755_c0_g1_i1:264-590(+)